MGRLLGKYVFQVHADCTLDEMIARLLEIEAMDDVQMTLDQAIDLDLEREGLEDAIEQLLVMYAHYTRH